jgi:hypothetical protein
MKFCVIPLILFFLISNFKVDCGAHDEQQSPQRLFQEMLDSLTPIQVDEFNQEFGVDHTNMRPRIFLAIIINVALVGTVMFGPAIAKGIYNGITELPHTLYDMASNFTSTLLQTAHQVALHNFNAADPQVQARMLQRLTEISRNNGNLPPTA